MLESAVAFLETGCVIEKAEREIIAADVDEILQWFDIDLDVEDAIRERDW